LGKRELGLYEKEEEWGHFERKKRKNHHGALTGNLVCSNVMEKNSVAAKGNKKNAFAG